MRSVKPAALRCLSHTEALTAAAAPAPTSHQLVNRQRRVKRQAAKPLPQPLPPWCSSFQKSVDPAALAFLGDAIWTLYVKRRYFMPPKHHSLYHQRVSKHVAAEQQACYYDALATGGRLTEIESELLMWAKAKNGTNFRKRFQSDAQQEQYRKSTGLEALVGYLQLTNTSRLQEVMALVEAAMAKSDASSS